VNATSRRDDRRATWEVVLHMYARSDVIDLGDFWARLFGLLKTPVFNFKIVR
jgi:hypothetical protein